MRLDNGEVESCKLKSTWDNRRICKIQPKEKNKYAGYEQVGFVLVRPENAIPLKIQVYSHRVAHTMTCESQTGSQEMGKEGSRG